MFVNSEIELIKLQNNCIKSQNQKTKIEFKCIICGKEATRRLLKKETRLICSRCLARKTCLEKYGVENASQLKEIKEKKKQTSLKHYGTENPMQSKEVLNTLKKNNFQKYGVENPAHLESSIKKSKKTCLKKYGREVFAQSSIYKEKCRETWSSKSKEELKDIESRRKQTSLEKYGSSGYNNREKFKRTMLKKFKRMHTNYIYRIGDLTFDSSWELAVYLYAKDYNWKIERDPCCFEYLKDGKIYKYFPDFKINGKLIEIKGNQFFNEEGKLYDPFSRELLEEKQKCMEQNNVEVWDKEKLKPILEYIKEKYGKEWKEKYK